MRHESITDVRRLCGVLATLVFIGCGDKRTPQMDTATAVDTARLTAAPDSDSVAVRSDSVDSLARIDTVPPGHLLTRWEAELDSANASRSWFVLRERQSIMELIPTRAVLADVPRPCSADSGQGVKPTAVNGEWIAMIADVPGLRAGAVEKATLADGPTRVGGQNDSTSFLFREERFMIYSDSQPDDRFSIFHEGKGGRLRFRDIDEDETGGWRVLWAGDLNRDGAPDVLMESSGGDNVKFVRLYMSGAFQADSIWKPAAALAHYGC